MSATDVLQQAEAAGVKVWAADGRIRYQPKDAPSDLVEALRHHKSEILEWLGSQFPEEKPHLLEHDTYGLSTIDRQPYPLGYGGFDLKEVAWALKWADRLHIEDPIYRKLHVLMWLASSYLSNGDKDMAIKARNEYHKLRHEDETITEACGLCEADRISPLESFEP